MESNRLRNYIEEIQSLELDGKDRFRDYKIDEAEKFLDQDELKVLIVYSTMINHMNTHANSEIMDIAEESVKQLKAASLDSEISVKFINSFYNFNNIYTPLYDLLDLATNGRFEGKPMSNDYRNGIIDSIITLRRYQRNSGFGDHQWDVVYNSAIEKGIKPIDTPHQH
jgi:hypothetical protein